MPVILPSATLTPETKTAGDIVIGALRLLRVWSSDLTLPAQDMEIGLAVLNEFIGGLSTEGLTVNRVVRDSFTITAAQSVYTWGTGGALAAIGRRAGRWKSCNAPSLSGRLWISRWLSFPMTITRR
jgi:hypothetical protein